VKGGFDGFDSDRGSRFYLAQSCHPNCHPTLEHGVGRDSIRSGIKVGETQPYQRNIHYMELRGTDAAELLNRYTLQRRIEGSNPSVSAKYIRKPLKCRCICWTFD
jgi:hypothetical protein